MVFAIRLMLMDTSSLRELSMARRRNQRAYSSRVVRLSSILLTIASLFCHHLRLRVVLNLDILFERNPTKMPLTCRFYKHKFPETDEVVMVNVRQIAEMGSYVNLLEYNKIEGTNRSLSHLA